MKIIIIGGSGFIGKHLVKMYSKNKKNLVVSVDKEKLSLYFDNLKSFTFDVNNYSDLEKIIIDFCPDIIINTAAKCDLEGNTIEDYSINYELPSNIINTVKSKPRFNPKILFFSTMLVYKVGFNPENSLDYNPSTAYGKSKLLMEKLIRNENNLRWVIVRPTSIWGPGFSTYKNFFFSVKNNWFIKIRNSEPKKSYGFILNIIFQIDSILKSENNLNKTYYLGDYEPMIINKWADIIADKWGVRRPISLPKFIIFLVSIIGTILNKIGIGFPLTIFRFKNMTTENYINKSHTKEICPNLPYTLNQAVIITIKHLRNR